MTSNREFLTKKFGAELNKKLKLKFGKKISSAKFADQFNLRAYGTSTITRETARKWLNGECIPDLDKFPVMIEWLGVDISEIVKNSYKESHNIVGHDVDNVLEDLTFLFNQYDLEIKKIALFIASVISKMDKKNSSIRYITDNSFSSLDECKICPYKVRDV